MTPSLLPLLPVLLLGEAGPVDASPERCSVRGPFAEAGYQWPDSQLEGFIQDAEVIVRVTALDELPGTRELSGKEIYWPRVRFQIDEIYKGALPADTLSLQGALVEGDDFNTGTVPYRIVRPSGQRGSCYTNEYTLAGQYLILLKDYGRGLQIAGGPLAPINEQIHGLEDPWVEWVRERIQ